MASSKSVNSEAMALSITCQLTGRIVSGLFGSGSSAFSAGGYGKVRYTLPLNSSVRPFVDGRVGYSYNLTNSGGSMVYGFGLGVHFAKKFKVGVYCYVGSKKEMETYNYITTYTTTSKHGKYGGTTKTFHYVVNDGTREVDKTTFTPALLFSMEL